MVYFALNAGVAITMRDERESVGKKAVDGQARLFDLSLDEQSRYDYIVALARRCFNYAYQAKAKAKSEKGESMPSMISEMALFSVVEEIAQDYLESRKLPRILFIDDIVLHGISLSNKIYSFTFALIEGIKRKWKIKYGTTVSEAELREQILSNIDMRVLVQKNATLLMEPKLRRRLWPVAVAEASEWHKISQDITKFLRGRDIAITSFVISAYIETQKLAFHKQDVDWEYVTIDIGKHTEGEEIKRQQDVYFLHSLEISEAIMPAVRVYKSDDYSFLIPYVFHGEMKVEEYKRVFSVLRNLMINRGLVFFAEKMAEALENLNDYKQCYYIQMAEMLMAQISLTLFLHQKLKPDTLADIKFDWDKIMLNFDAKGSANDWQALCETRWSFEELLQICDKLTPVTEQEVNDDSETYDDRVIIERCLNTAYECGIEHCIRSYCMIRDQEGKEVAVATRDYLNELSYKLGTKSIKDWITSIVKSETISLSVLQKVLCVAVYLIDNGYMALRMDKWLCKEECFSGICFSHTELTMSLYKDMFSSEWDRVCSAASFCKRNGLSYDVFLGDPLSVREISDEQKKRENQVGETLTQYEGLFSEIIDW